MSMVKISETGLMFVDDPIDLLMAFCKHPDGNMTKESFIQVYRKIKQKDKVGSKVPDTHVGTLHYYNLIESNPEFPIGTYRKTATGNTLCKLLKKRKTEKNEFQKFLAAIILSHPQKGKLFKNFLNFIKKERTVEEIRDKYKWNVGLTLIAWCVEAGLAWRVDDRVIRSIDYEQGIEEIPIEEFWNSIKKTYEKIRITDEGRKNLFVDFQDIRLICTRSLKLKNPRIFDKMFTKLMRSEYKHLINLHGAPTGEFSKMANFEYKGRLYPYLSLVR